MTAAYVVKSRIQAIPCNEFSIIGKCFCPEAAEDAGRVPVLETDQGSVKMNTPTSDPTERTEKFVQHLTENQNRLYGYIYSLLGNHARAADVIQETNLVMWRKVDEFQIDKPFLPWAFAIARFQVLAHLRDLKRDRCLLDSDLVQTLSREVERESEQLESLRHALRRCLKALRTDQLRLIELRYYGEKSIAEVAAVVGKTPGAVKVSMLRVRKALGECVQRGTSAEG